MSDKPPRRFAQIIKLKPEHVAEYKQVHARVWPEVLAQNEQCNIRDCTLKPSLSRRQSNKIP
jgi:L-rhamnose mutarotase